MKNNLGFTIIAVPLTLALVSLLGSGALATISYSKTLADHRDNQRQQDMAVVQQKLNDYHTQNSSYPVQKDDSNNSWEILKQSLSDLPVDPLAEQGWSYYYWSDGQVYNLRYIQERSMEEQVIYSY